MADVYNTKKRSEIMSKISEKETKPEIIVRKYLHDHGFRYRKNDKRLAGKPDIVLPRHKTLVFVHGCFWHGHNCKAAKLPETRKDFWESKIGATAKRDKKNNFELSKLGWKIIVIWQCELKNKELRKIRLTNLIKQITG